MHKSSHHEHRSSVSSSSSGHKPGKHSGHHHHHSLGPPPGVDPQVPGKGHHHHHLHSLGPPPGVDPQVWHSFAAVDADRSGYITADELQTALVNGNGTRFDLDTVKLLMNIFDTDRSGSIGFEEFTGLWKYIIDWQNVFRHFDRDRSGTIDGKELAEALRSFGYNFSQSLLTLIEHKFASGPLTEKGPPPTITFDRFIRACVTVKTLTDSFKRLDADKDGWVRINYEQFITLVLKAP